MSDQLLTRSARPWRPLLLWAGLLASLPAAMSAQIDTLVAYRWVGLRGDQQLWLDFYDDSMVVVDDAAVCDYRATRDSLVVWGDTVFSVAYSLVLDRLLLQTADGDVVTMARQDLLARPMWGTWRGSEIGGRNRQIELALFRGGPARWRVLPGGGWTVGEWNRRSRSISILWLPDSVTWIGQYDPGGAALQIADTTEGGSTIILRHIIR